MWAGIQIFLTHSYLSYGERTNVGQRKIVDQVQMDQVTVPKIKQDRVLRPCLGIELLASIHHCVPFPENCKTGDYRNATGVDQNTASSKIRPTKERNKCRNTLFCQNPTKSSKPNTTF